MFSPTRQPELDAIDVQRRVIHELPTRRTPDEELVAALRQGQREAAGAVFDRYGKAVERVIWGVMGPEPDTEDILHEVFLRAIAAIDDLDDAHRLRSWLFGIAVFTSREWIRKRTRRRWLRFVEEVPEPRPITGGRAREEVSEATRLTFEILAALSERERVLFSLRFIEGMEIAEIAVVCDCSLSTTKRRLKSAERHFLARARNVPALHSWIEEGGRWELP